LLIKYILLVIKQGREGDVRFYRRHGCSDIHTFIPFCLLDTAFDDAYFFLRCDWRVVYVSDVEMAFTALSRGGLGTLASGGGYQEGTGTCETFTEARFYGVGHSGGR
jgi:hypothetical protein